ncbi:hypothetical protein N7462_000931 [Penicillium macrosclerotiorum]|uniref:uncharacterized protein n=1 Tax=Penicillium macrosclerotiorum TaxID=303699 RepID=UPI00254782DE|nr:uncharacterized protein N7462_000931 [Penicillium macrosclerotiorum]KAJ5698926.1 hypothetical protein N7462_000931 [Penicillium macrosclerotiorum]
MTEEKLPEGEIIGVVIGAIVLFFLISMVPIESSGSLESGTDIVFLSGQRYHVVPSAPHRRSGHERSSQYEFANGAGFVGGAMVGATECT